MPRSLRLLALLVLGACSSSETFVRSPRSSARSPQSGLTLAAVYGGELDSTLPTHLLWKPDGRSFLYREEVGDETMLREQTVASGEVRDVLNWSELTDALEALRPDYEKPAMGDTNRTGRFSFSPRLSPDGTHLVGTQSGDLFVVHLHEEWSAGFLTEAAGDEIFFRWRPDGEAVAFARDGDLWLVDLDGNETRLTDRGDDETVLNGTADWTYEEELALRQSFWWSPDGASIAYLQFDVSPIPVFPITDELSLVPDLERQRYPKTGTANARVRLGVLELASGETTWLASGDAPEGYLVDAEWIDEGPAAGTLWYLWMNRDQTRLELRHVEADGATRTLVTETDERWVEVGPDPVFLADGTFLWTSEESGWRHLYRHGLDGSRRDTLTSGEFAVSSIDGLVDGGAGVLFRSNQGNTIETHVWRVGLDGRDRRRLTNEPGTHRPELAPDGTVWFDTWSTTEQPPRLDLVTADGSLVRTIDDGTIPALARHTLSPARLELARMNDGTELWTRTVYPPDYDPSVEWPVIVYVYGGPGAMLVKNSWGGQRGLYHQFLAQRGAIVFTIDNRGAGGRGAEFERQLYRKLGTIEVTDQVRGVEWLAQRANIDEDRVGIYGGSYGGFMTLNCLMRAPDTFRSGVAWAPVTDFRFYDTIYTERYLDRPQDHPAGYDDGAPLSYVDGLRDGSLLLAHGLMDNNVHFQNSVELISKLVKAEKQFELMTYPRTRHGIRGEANRLHFARLSFDFFARTLGLGPRL